ncbi:DsrE family protein [Haloglycomyces albus]|uniref:DsrE family protein n=1 Tax=Haloglycomyces albus TaxID=526067 RepID=UPI00046D8EED|nr:DsrE family protein [Haloglycomyces albus]
MAPTALQRSDLLVALMGAPHDNDMATTALRLVEASLAREANVQVWTCGYATMLTQKSLGDDKPRNLLDWQTHYPSVAEVITGLVAQHPEHLRWYSCRFCSEERGATDHVDHVRLRPPFAFNKHVEAADTTVMMGVV